jgi:acetyl esterase/lipase
MDVADQRRMLEDMLPLINAEVDTTGLAIDDRSVPGPDGQPDVVVRTYRPVDPTGAGILYLHGGGFTVGSLDSEHAKAATLAREVGAVVVSVGYRLAPEHPFPAGLEDGYAALQWFSGAAADLGVDPARMAVVGSSAGGGLAAALALLARDRGGPALCFQFLGIPELDDRLTTPSMTTFVDTPVFNRPAAVESWRHYLGPEPGETSPYAAPARATDLAGLPPAYISTMELDPLRDEGIAYAMALLAAGVTCELHSFPGTFHGSAMVATAQVSQREAAEMVDVLRRRLA